MSEQTGADMDGGWKQMIEDYLEEFFRFFFPDVHASINFQAGHKFLDKELAKVLVDTETGDRRADKLIQVQWIDGTIEWILLHVEVKLNMMPILLSGCMCTTTASGIAIRSR